MPVFEDENQNVKDLLKLSKELTKENLSLRKYTTEELLIKLIDNQSRANYAIIDLLSSIGRPTSKKHHYYDVSDSIATAVTTMPADADVSGYTRLNVWEQINRNAERLTIYNDGPGTMYVRISHSNAGQFSAEFPLYEGEAKAYQNIFEVRMRATRANCAYRATEYELWKQKNVDFRAGRGYVRTQTVAVAGATIQLAYNNADVHNFNSYLTRNASTGYIKNTNALTDLYVWFSQDGTEYGQSGSGVTVEYTTVDPNGAINIDYMDVYSVKIGSTGLITYQIVVA